MWESQYTQKAAKSILKLNPTLRVRMVEELEKLQGDPDLGKQLTGPLKGLRSLRVGEYLIIYKKESNALIVLIIAVGHRKNIYKGR